MFILSHLSKVTNLSHLYHNNDCILQSSVRSHITYLVY
uniref:Uncharacterized protein n=1 Tax=Anguilla anguilla TaxID=7936 RepID=A0A0E9WB42_ANGAN